MSKAVLISIRPEWVEKIMSGEKTLEVRKTRPKLETPFKCYIYRTKGTVPHIINDKCVQMEVGGTVVGEFVCDKIDCVDIPYPAFMGELDKHWMKNSCCTYYQLHRYFYHDRAYFWHISNLKIYERLHKLDEFERPYDCDRCNAQWATECNECHAENKLKRPPQSWCYVEGLK